MKIRFIKFAFSLAAFGVILQTHGQGTFQNLDFESPVLPLVPNLNGYVPITNALPGWRGYIGANETSGVFYNNVSIGAAAISLHGPGGSRPPFEGSYSVILQVEYPSGTPIAAIGQTGQIPLTANSLIFYVYNLNIQVTFGGQVIPTYYLGPGGTSAYQKFAGDISGLAGQTGELRFSSVFSAGNLDGISFSPEVVPEPSVLGLFALGSLLLGWSRWKR